MIALSFNTKENWVILDSIELSIKSKIEQHGVKLCDWNVSINRGVLTGYNEAFIIDETTKNMLIESDPKSAELIRPILRGKDIKRYGYNFANKYLICIPCGFTNKHTSFDQENWIKQTYPSIYNHLVNMEEEKAKVRSNKSKGLYSRDDQGDYWWELRSCKYIDEFYKQKIMYNDINRRLSFCMVPEGYFCNNTVYFMCPNKHIEYFMAVLNSKIIDWYYKNLSVQLGDNAVRMFSIYVNKIPIPIVDETLEQKIKVLVTQHINTKNSISDNSIDEEIFKLFELNDDEINYISSIYKK